MRAVARSGGALSVAADWRRARERASIWAVMEEKMYMVSM